ncbi:hypothetical protein JW988_00865 [Candidatus Bathyarchaeota archaeon]|nr:hypothetical protein [Candidatus Bathyarchaeota archaeon]
MKNISENYKNPIEIAAELGRSFGGLLGEKGIVECKLAYALKLLPKFTADEVIRMNQQVLLYWQAGYFKSTILKVFCETVPPHLKPTDLTSMTFEKIFGSINEKTGFTVPPVFTNEVKFVKIPELTTVLGQRDSMKQFANTLNLVLEGERISRQTLKLGGDATDQNQREKLEKEKKKLKDIGVDYDYRVGELAYTPDVCVLAGTRPLENTQFTYLNKSGFFDRYHVIQHRVTDEEASRYFHKDFKLDLEKKAALTTVNSKLSEVRVSKVLCPTEEFMAPIYDNLEAIVKDEITETRLELSEVIPPRLKGNVLRELVGFSFLRTAAENGFNNIIQLEYTNEDKKFILDRLPHFIDFAMDPLIAASFTIKSKTPSKREQCKNVILNLLKDDEWDESEEVISAVEHYFLSKSKTISGALIYLALGDLKKAGKILHKHNQYKIAIPEERS